MPRRRLDHRRGTVLQIDLAKEAPRKRDVIDLTVRRGRDSIRSNALGRVPDRHRTGCRIETAVDAALSGEPDSPLAVEGCCVETGVGACSGQWPGLHLFGPGVDAEYGVQAAVGDPSGTIGPDNYAMRRRALTQRYALDLAVLRIELTEHAGLLARVPDGSVRRRRHIVGMIAFRDGKIADLRCSGRTTDEQHQANKDKSRAA